MNDCRRRRASGIFFGRSTAGGGEFACTVDGVVAGGSSDGGLGGGGALGVVDGVALGVVEGGVGNTTGGIGGGVTTGWFVVGGGATLALVVVGVVCSGCGGTVISLRSSAILRGSGCLCKGTNFRKNFRLRRVGRREPSILMVYWSCWCTSVTCPVLSHFRGLLPTWFCTLTWSPTAKGGS